MMSYVPASPSPFSRTRVPLSDVKKYQLPSDANSIPAADDPNAAGVELHLYQRPSKAARNASAEAMVLVTPDGATLHPAGPRQGAVAAIVVVVVVMQSGRVAVVDVVAWQILD